MDKVAIVVGVCLVAMVVATILQRRAPAPTREGPDRVPTRVDLADFGGPRVPWVVVLFSSSSCDSCEDVRAKVVPLRSDHVAVFDVTYQEDRALHRKYQVDAVPMCLLVDAAGSVRQSFIGPVSSTHLWGALADLRDPGSVPDGCAAAHEHAEAHHDAERRADPDQSDSGGLDGTMPPDT